MKEGFCLFLFFFQAEDGIRDADVTGVQTCALPISLGVVTSLLLPLIHGEFALMMIYGLAGLGVAAFTPSALSMVGDAAPPGRAGYAFAWYTTAHYGAIGIGSFLGGLVRQWSGDPAALVPSG